MTGALVMTQTVQIMGTVISSEDGLTLPGVTIAVKGTTLGAFSDTDGKYLISALSSATTLVFSYIGFKSQKGAAIP